ncbi:MAG: hypothetical protein AAFQ43_06200 [Bacteroidota bacterium]
MLRFFLLPLVALALLAPEVRAQPSAAPLLLPLLEAPGNTYWSNGKFWFFGQHHFAFLPNDQGYKSYGDGPKLELRYLRDGTEVARNALDTRPYSGPIQVTSEQGGIDFDDTGAGSYVAEWLIDGEPIYQLPFTAEEITSDDPYASGSKWALDGPWGEYLTLKVPRGNTVGPVTILFFDRVKAYERNRGGDRGVMVTVERDGEPVWRVPGNDWYHDKGPNFSEFNGVGGSTYSETPWWSLIEVTPKTFHPEGSGFDTSNMQHQGVDITPDMLEDGTYTVTVQMFDHGDVEDNATLDNIRANVTSTRTATFDVSGGNIVPQGQQASGADPMTRLEGAQEDLNFLYTFVPWAEAGN